MATPRAVLLLALLLPAWAGCATPAADPAPSAPALPTGPHLSWNATLESFDGTRIAYTVWKPAAAGPAAPVPVILQGHPWSQARWRADHPDLRPFLAAGFGVVSFDHRGHGESGGEAWMLDPDREVRDVLLLIDTIAAWDWVLLDGPGDPRLGTTGWSYGGAFQWMVAMEEVWRSGTTRIDAIAPQTTWFDLSDSFFAPNGVPSSYWIGVHVALAAAGNVRPAPVILEGYAATTASGDPDPALLDLFARHSPAWYAQRGVRLDIPALIQQGVTDTVFPLNEALAAREHALTTEARAASVLVAHRNGHPIVGLQRMGDGVLLANPCTGDANWYAAETQARWFAAHLAGQDTDFGAAVQLATHDGDCLRLQGLPPRAAHWPAPATAVGTPVPLAAGARTALALLSGPATVAGVPLLSANLSGVGPDTRLFFALGVGDAAAPRIAGEQWTPLRATAAGELAVPALEMAGVVEHVPAGATLFLVVTPASEQYAAHGSRAPGAVLLRDVRLDLPLLSDPVPTPATVK